MSDKAIQFECAKADLRRALEKHCGATAVIEDGGDAEGIFMSLLSGVGNGDLYGALPSTQGGVSCAKEGSFEKLASAHHAHQCGRLIIWLVPKRPGHLIAG